MFICMKIFTAVYSTEVQELKLKFKLPQEKQTTKVSIKN